MPVKNSKVKIQPIQQAQGKKLKVKTATKKAVAKPKTIRVTGLKAEVFDVKGKVVETINLPKEIFGAKVNEQLMAQAVRVYLFNQRQGTVSTKTRGEVNATTAKVWRQKGTGRARHGAKSAPIWVGGGVAFGPKPRDFSKNLSKKMKRAALFSALSAKQKSGEIKVLSGLEKIQPKTKSFAKVLQSLALYTKKKNILLVMPENVDTITQGVRNIEGVRFTAANRLNTYEVLGTKALLLMKDSVMSLEKTFLKRE